MKPENGVMYNILPETKALALPSTKTLKKKLSLSISVANKERLNSSFSLTSALSIRLITGGSFIG